MAQLTKYTKATKATRQASAKNDRNRFAALPSERYSQCAKLAHIARSTATMKNARENGALDLTSPLTSLLARHFWTSRGSMPKDSTCVNINRDKRDQVGGQCEQ